MAKISAHGEKAHYTYEAENGARVVLTKKPDLRPGRLLHKPTRDHVYNVVKTYRRGTPLLEASIDADEYAAARGMVRV